MSLLIFTQFPSSPIHLYFTRIYHFSYFSLFCRRYSVSPYSALSHTFSVSSPQPKQFPFHPPTILFAVGLGVFSFASLIATYFSFFRPPHIFLVLSASSPTPPHGGGQRRVVFLSFIPLIALCFFLLKFTFPLFFAVSRHYR